MKATRYAVLMLVLVCVVSCGPSRRDLAIRDSMRSIKVAQTHKDQTALIRECKVKGLVKAAFRAQYSTNKQDANEMIERYTINSFPIAYNYAFGDIFTIVDEEPCDIVIVPVMTDYSLEILTVKRAPSEPHDRRKYYDVTYKAAMKCSVRVLDHFNNTIKEAVKSGDHEGTINVIGGLQHDAFELYNFVDAAWDADQVLAMELVPQQVKELFEDGLLEAQLESLKAQKPGKRKQ